MANVKFCPAAWLDEISPAEETPEAFARRHDGGWLLIDPDEPSAEEGKSLEPGQIVEFARLVMHPDFTLTINEDRSWTASGSYEPQAEWYRFAESDDHLDCYDTIADLVTNYNGSAGDPPEAGEHRIECWTWTDGFHFRFEPDGETPRFILCSGTN